LLLLLLLIFVDMGTIDDLKFSPKTNKQTKKQWVAFGRRCGGVFCIALCCFVVILCTLVALHQSIKLIGELIKVSLEVASELSEGEQMF